MYNLSIIPKIFNNLDYLSVKNPISLIGFSDQSCRMVGEDSPPNINYLVGKLRGSSGDAPAIFHLFETLTLIP